MNLDLYTLAAFIVGISAGTLVGYWLAKFITGLTVERLERKVQSLSDDKFELSGQRVRLKQLEQRLDAEAARIPMAEREMQDKSDEIRELTAALNETTALTTDLTAALRARKAKVKQLEIEQTKWLKRNKALLMKSESTEEKIAQLSSDVAKQRKLASEQNGVATAHVAEAPEASKAENGSSETTKGAAPALAATHHIMPGQSYGNVDQLTSRMEEIESNLQNWFERVGKLEANATGQMKQASGLALLEQVLRGEAETQDAAAQDAANQEAIGGQ